MSRAPGALVVGVGGIGAPAAALLAASGAARLGLIDPDVVELSNLPRQPLFGSGDLGKRKVEVAAARLVTATPRLEVQAHVGRLDRRTKGLVRDYDVIVDGTDNLETKALLNEVALESGIPLVHAGVLGLEGQVLTILPRASACLRCLFPELPDPAELASCEQAGVLGPVVGAIGALAAREALAVLEARAPSRAGRLAILEGARLRWRLIEVPRNPRCPSCGAGLRPDERLASQPGGRQ
jgi:adenylyltransferase/sulfurtransferase